jgi:hypothetical protein
MLILKINDNSKWIVSDSPHLISPAGYHPSAKVVGVKAGVRIKQYQTGTQKQVEARALKDFPNAKQLMLWNVAEHYSKYQ